jgi:hypothetical protein
MAIQKTFGDYLVSRNRSLIVPSDYKELDWHSIFEVNDPERVILSSDLLDPTPSFFQKQEIKRIQVYDSKIVNANWYVNFLRPTHFSIDTLKKGFQILNQNLEFIKEEFEKSAPKILLPFTNGDLFMLEITPPVNVKVGVEVKYANKVATSRYNVLLLPE